LSEDRSPTAAHWLVLAPGLVLEAWLLGTFALWWVLVRSAVDQNVAAVTAVVMAGSALFGIGYLIAVRWSWVAGLGPAPKFGRRTTEGLLLAGALYYVGRGLGNLGPIVSAGFDTTNPFCTLADAYVKRQESFGEDASFSGLQSVLNLFGALAFTTVPLLVLAGSQVRSWVRRATVGALIAYSITWLLVGSVKGLADLGVLVVAALAVRLARHRTGADASPLDVRRTVQAATVVTVASALVAMALLGLRTASPGACFGMQPALDPTSSPSTPVPNSSPSTPVPNSSPSTPVPTPDHSHVVNVPTNGLSVVVWYVSHGYSGLDASLSVPFVWTQGTGASPGLARFLKIVGIDKADQAYPVRAESATGWPALGRWQTMYPWLASDTTFPGAVLLVGVLGFGLALSWRRAIADPSGLLSATWFGVLLIVGVYVPLNNQPIAATSSVLGIPLLAAATLFWVLRSNRTPPGAAAENGR
jgi:hypothetical protein